MADSDIRALDPAAGTLSDEELAARYAVADRSAPWLRANFVSSVDGAATHDGLSEGLGSPSDQRVFQVLRWLADVIIVGAGTVRAEGYSGSLLDEAAVDWRRSHGLAPHPEFAIVSARLNLDPASSLFTDAPVRPLVITCSAAPDDRRAALAEVADLIDCGDTRVDTALMRSALAERGLPQMHSEGGPHLLGAMIEDGAIDELCITISARLEGGTARRITDGHLASATPMRLAHALSAEDGTLLLRYTRA
ncbi:pyrimidine reductase family protein [Parafrigoribacterium soli]|uniref:pyrimidine reductase family protein n=1 Tax=Parafrigoribacterium soli TaxID=3144663 RepID=UPI0032EC93E4